MANNNAAQDQSTPKISSTTSNETTYRVSSIDPVVAEVHAIRAKEWDRYGENSQAWFDAMLQRQVQRVRQLAA